MYAHGTGRHDDDAALNGIEVEAVQQRLGQADIGATALTRQPEQDDTAVRTRRMHSGIGEPLVRGEEAAVFTLDHRPELLVGHAGQARLHDGDRVVACSPQGEGNIGRQVLVNFDAQGWRSYSASGNRSKRLTASAANDRAAWMSSRVS